MTDTDQTTPSIDVAGLLEGVLAALFGAAAQTSPPTLVHPVLGHVEKRILGLWPAPTPATPSTGQPATPARLHAPRGLRSFLIGAAAASQAMGKLTMLGLPIDLLQESWSPDGATIGEVSVQVVDDASAEPGDALAAAASRLSLTTSAVDAVWELDPLALDDDTGAAVAATYADLMTATLLGHAGTAEFEAAAAGRPLEDLLAEGRQYLAETAATWLTVVLGLVRLRAAQQADADAADYAAELDTIVTAYNQAKAAPAASPFTTYLAEELLANHPSTQPLPDAEASVDGEHFTDALRSAVRHTDAGSPIEEDGGPDHPPDAGPDPGDLGNPILASAAALAGQLQTYTQDPLERWEDDKGDCSSFVQRALFGPASRCSTQDPPTRTSGAPSPSPPATTSSPPLSRPMRAPVTCSFRAATRPSTGSSPGRGTAESSGASRPPTRTCSRASRWTGTGPLSRGCGARTHRRGISPAPPISGSAGCGPRGRGQPADRGTRPTRWVTSCGIRSRPRRSTRVTLPP